MRVNRNTATLALTLSWASRGMRSVCAKIGAIPCISATNSAR